MAAGLSPVLCELTYRCTAVLAVILGVVGLMVPWALGYALPESHMADGPWSYEEMCGYMIALTLLWRMQQQLRQRHNPSGMLMGGVMVIFVAVAMLWIVRWDLMANVGYVQGVWILGNSVQWEWLRLIPKGLHLLFSAFVAGGIIVACLGLFNLLSSSPGMEEDGTDSEQNSPPIIRYGVGWILSGLVTQMLIGPWLFLLLNTESQTVLIDGSSLTSVLFFVSVTTALLALVLLNASFMVPHMKGLLWGGLVNASLTLIMMGIVRYEAFMTTLSFHRMPVAIVDLSGWHVVSVFILTGLLGAIMVRWCVWPLESVKMKVLS